MMIDTLRALTVAANSLRFNPEIDPDAAGRYEKVLTNLRDKLGRDMESNPLTLDELREMDGEPVWLRGNGLNRWYIFDGFSLDGIPFFTPEIGYGKTWLAYRRKPKASSSKADPDWCNHIRTRFEKVN